MDAIHPGVLGSTRMVTNQLTDDELASAYLAATAGWDIDSEVVGYEKFKPLLTQNGKRMHSATIEALDIIVQERLGTR